MFQISQRLREYLEPLVTDFQSTQHELQIFELLQRSQTVREGHEPVVSHCIESHPDFQVFELIAWGLKQALLKRFEPDVRKLILIQSELQMLNLR